MSIILGSLLQTIAYIYIGVTLKDLSSYMDNDTEFRIEETLVTILIVLIIIVGFSFLTRKAKRHLESLI